MGVISYYNDFGLVWYYYFFYEVICKLRNKVGLMNRVCIDVNNDIDVFC